MKRILVIDDDDDLRESLRMVLQMEGFEVFEAADGAHGVELAQTIQPDLITCDMKMPGYDGSQVMEILSSSPETAHVPIVFISAGDNAVADTVHTHYRFVQKPFDVLQLISMIKQHV